MCDMIVHLVFILYRRIKQGYNSSGPICASSIRKGDLNWTMLFEFLCTFKRSIISQF